MFFSLPKLKDDLRWSACHIFSVWHLAVSPPVNDADASTAFVWVMEFRFSSSADSLKPSKCSWCHIRFSEGPLLWHQERRMNLIFDICFIIYTGWYSHLLSWLFYKTSQFLFWGCCHEFGLNLNPNVWQLICTLPFALHVVRVVLVLFSRFYFKFPSISPRPSGHQKRHKCLEFVVSLHHFSLCVVSVWFVWSSVTSLMLTAALRESTVYWFTWTPAFCCSALSLTAVDFEGNASALTWFFCGQTEGCFLAKQLICLFKL